MDSSMIDNFALPDGAAEALKKQNRQMVSLSDGVTRSTAGHDKGVSFRFWVHSEFNKLKSKAAKYEKSDEVEMIEWHTDRYNRPTERVKDLGPELLEFDDETHECIGGRYADAYRRWKQGMTAPGLPLSKWGVLADGWVTTLAANGIFSVEQFAAMPRSKIDGKFPQEVSEAFERAILFVSMKEGRAQSDKQAEEIVELQRTKAKQAAEIEELRQQMNALLSGRDAATKRSKKKESEEHGD